MHAFKMAEPFFASVDLFLIPANLIISIGWLLGVRTPPPVLMPTDHPRHPSEILQRSKVGKLLETLLTNGKGFTSVGTVSSSALGLAFGRSQTQLIAHVSGIRTVRPLRALRSLPVTRWPSRRARASN